jgi:tetratricopeptide (TPR) repeat protein
LAHAALAQDEPKKALNHLKAAEKAHAASLDADAWFLRGQVHEALGEPKAAIKAYRQALADEDAPDALEALTRLSIAVDSKREAADYLRRLAVSLAGEAEGLARAAELAIELGRYDDAVDLVHQSRLGDGGIHQAARRPLGLALYHQGKFADAIEQLEKADANAESLATLTKAFAAVGRLTDAEAQLTRLEMVEPSAESRQAVAWVRSLITRRTALMPSVRAASATTQAVSTSIEKTVCAEGFNKLGLWPEQVERLLDDAIAERDPSGAAFGLRATIRIGRGQFTAALRDAESAINLSPNEASGYHARGRIRLERTQPGAVADLERAAQLSATKDASVLHDLAAAYLAVGRRAEALPLQREAAKLNPQDRSIREQLREMESTK